MKKFAVLLAGISTIALSGCVTQEQADAKMIKGCEAAVAAMIEPTTIKEVKASTAAPEKTMGSVYRRVKVSYTEQGDFAETVKEGSCLFSEQWGMFKSSHAAMLEQVTWGDNQLIGKKDGNIEGDMNQFMRFQSANAMEADRQRCLAAGMNEHLAKPLTAAALRGTIERWLPRS